MATPFGYRTFLALEAFWLTAGLVAAVLRLL